MYDKNFQLQVQFSLSPLKIIAKKVGTYDNSPVVSQSGMKITSGSWEKSAASTQMYCIDDTYLPSHHFPTAVIQIA